MKITERSRLGKLESRVQQHPRTGCWFVCSRCWDSRHDTGLNGEPAATPEDLCVGALVDGWVFTSVDQICPDCRKLKRHYVFAFGTCLNRYGEWWMRKCGGPIGMVPAVFSLEMLFIGMFGWGIPALIKLWM